MPAASAQSVPVTMTKMVVRWSAPSSPATGFEAQPRTIYRAGMRFSRVEEVPDKEHGIHGVIIVNEPDVWMVNLFNNSARHGSDTSPTAVCRMPLFSDGDGHASKALADLEFGRELTYFKRNNATLTAGPVIAGRATKHYGLDEGGYHLELFTTGHPERPLIVKRTHGANWELYSYNLYEEIPFERRLFVQPSGVAIRK
jgi:hypothetical protein